MHASECLFIVFQLIFWMFTLSLLCFFFPIHTICVLSVLTLSPENEPNISNMFSAACSDSTVPFKIKVVSSANCTNLNSVFPIFMPFYILIKFYQNS